MDLDIRTPIGAMFLILGVLVLGFGLASDATIYQKSLGININLWWGASALLFGGTMFYFGRRAKR